MSKLITTLFIFLLSSSSFTAGGPRAPKFVFKTKFKNYSCTRFSKKDASRVELNQKGYLALGLDITKNTRLAKINFQSVDQICHYSALFTRKKGEIKTSFYESKINDDLACSDMKEYLDQLLEDGFSYHVKFNAYLSVHIPKSFTSECDETTGKTYLEFAWDLI
ncbi:MAG: hypothetical protein CME63_13345 [Halobacteriovoraceae bacterium]|nr:hypothetical protein [Halobacteriovoraceae bacterium]|tara:strand:- start:7159 stop:7650 length:492 start_codon:yes stop_codon:yes gene_type:complete